MDITPTTTVLPPNHNHPPPPVTKSQEPELETPTRIQHVIKPLSFSNGVLKRHHQHAILRHVSPVSVTYKECLKNHAAAMGVHSVDGCGEFMPSPSATATDPTSLKCAACGCHRNFHRREPDLDHHSSPPPLPAAIEYQPHHRHHPPPPPPPPQFQRPSPSSSSPPPISSSYAPHMLMALSTGSEPSPRKRHRTRFSPVQKEQMFRFAERLGWKMQKRDDELIQAFCNEAKIDKGVLKVWMHNNKNTFGKRVLLDAAVGANNNGAGADKITNKSNGTTSHHHDDEDDEDEEDEENGIDRRQLQFGISVAGGGPANGGSSSSS